MINKELFALSILGRDYFITAYTDVDLDVPAGTTVTLTYSNPSPERYMWFGIEFRVSPLMNNRVFNTTVQYDEHRYEFENIELSKCLSFISNRSLLASVCNNTWKMIVTNTSASTQTLDLYVIGILVDKNHVDKIFDIFAKTIVTLDDNSIDKLAKKIGEQLKTFTPQFVKKE